MDKIKLLPHNQEMVYRIEQAMMCGNRKIFYTEATGLGKSYIFMYLVNKYFKDKKVLYICPKNHIWYNMQEYKEFELIKDCVTYICNADFNKIKQRHLDYDVIFIDEAHHLCTPIQGENIINVANNMLEENPNSYVFGFTATPYINGEMIGDKYFDTSIIGMDLFTAIEKGILQRIQYAVAITNDSDLYKYKDMFTIKYDVATTNVIITDIINKYNTVNHWLAYFTTISELNTNIEYFNKYFPEYKVFAIHSEIENSDEILNDFENYNGKAILASVSMVLEGIHPRTVEGILLYRNVCTVNTFIQIIGRLGIMKPNVSPICVDIYNSYENIIDGKNIIRELTNVDSTCTRHYKDYFYMDISTYKFIDLYNTAYNSIYKIHEYRGITWRTNIELSKKLGKCSEYVSDRINHAGKSYEEIIDYCLDNPVQGPRTYRGITWTNNIDLSKKLGKSTNYVSIYKRKGMTCEDLIDRYLENHAQGPRTYRGITWSTNKELSKKLGRYDGYVYQSLSKGKSYEEIIDYCLDNPVQGPRTYRGITWSTNVELANQIGIRSSLISAYCCKGKSYEEIIDYCLDNPVQGPRTYRGITWTNNIDLSKKLGRSKGYVGMYKRKGITCEDLIDQYLDNPVQGPRTYRGITWETDADLSRQLSISQSSISIHRRNCKTYEAIIDYYLDKHVRCPRTYRGITWTTNAELDRLLNVQPDYVGRHIRKGKSYEEIIDYCIDKYKTKNNIK
jgi:hypothetical protein